MLGGARTRSVDPLTVLTSATTQVQGEIIEAARAAGLDNDTINNVSWKAESDEKGSGWSAIKSATTDRLVEEAEASARAVGVDVAAVLEVARAADVDPLTALTSATTQVQGEIIEAARAAGLDNDTINNVSWKAESEEKGSGWSAIKSATTDRLVEEAEASARAVGVDVAAVLEVARAADVDPLTALKSATKQVQEIKAAARAVGLDDDAIDRIHSEAEERDLGSGWAAVEEATVDESRVREIIEKICEEFGSVRSASMVRAVARILREEYRESAGAGRLVARLTEIPDGYYALSADEVEERIDREQLQEQRYQQACEGYKKERADYEKKGYWERRRHAAPEEPQRSPASDPPSEEEITRHRLKLIDRIVQFVRAVIERLLDWRDKPLPPAPVHPGSVRAPRRQQERGKEWSR